MIEQVPSGDGNVGHWLVTPDSSCTLIRAHMLKNHSAVELITSNLNGSLDVRKFLPPDPVAVALPEGRWRVESADETRVYFEEGVLTSEQLDSGPSQRVNILCNGSEFPQRWARFTKL